MGKASVQQALDTQGLEAGKKFGLPAYSHDGKMVMLLRDEGLLVKVGQKRAQELIGQGKPFNKYIAPGINAEWKAWVLVDYDQAEAQLKDAKLVEAAKAAANS